ncbi:uncharacterized protein VTP21DRAFT_7412 [Calcarisporiella thermophila]|uniref:uncharacterized protein n=1 Tax=Calcarisporiella thermophila TaxID=911321 RepID=UPI003743D971
MPHQQQDMARRVSLSELERADKLTWRQIRTVLISSVGFFTDAYDIFIMNLVSPMLGFVYYAGMGNHMPPAVEGPLKGMVTFGTFVGQLLFGYIGDTYGRKAIYGFELIIIVVATIFCATASSAVRGVSAIGYLFFWRFILGIGIGGDYPMSATITSEWAVRGRRGQMMSLVFSMQGLGNFTACVVTTILLLIFRGAIEADQLNIDYVWRLCIGLGAIPSFLTVYSRLSLPESPRYTKDVLKDEERAMDAIGPNESAKNNDSASEEDIKPQTTSEVKDTATQPANSPAPQAENRAAEQWRDFRHYYSQWRNLRVLLGTSITWFLLDIAFYGIALNQAYVLQAIGFAGGSNPWDTLFKQATGNLIISVLGALPGYYASVFLIERLGRKPIQYIGFFMTAILFAILAIFFHQIQQNSIAAFIVLFAVTQFFFQFGPNTTTFVLAAEVFPTRYRATSHGISAAAGKLGAILATFGFNLLVEVGGEPGQHAFLPQTLGIFAAVMFVGGLFTPLIPETKGKSLDYFEQEREEEIGLIRKLRRRKAQMEKGVEEEEKQ